MYTGDLPLLTKGPFALFYGGQQIFPQLSNQSSGHSFQAIIFLSLIFQIILSLYKKMKVKKLEDYVSLLRHSVVQNILNVYSIFSILTIFIISFCYIIRHTLCIEENRRNTEPVNFIPDEIVFIYVFAGTLVLIPFLRCHALRYETQILGLSCA